MSTQFIGDQYRQKGNAAYVRVPKTAELVARRIRNAIIRGELKEDDTLPAEAHLIAEFEVSRPTLREAIRILESEGLLKVTRGARGGAVVCSPGYEMVSRAAGIALQTKGATVADLYEMRTLLEPPAARLVAERNSKKGADALEAHLEVEQSLVGDRYAVSQAIAQFHILLIDLSGNITLAMIAHAVHNLVERHKEVAQQREPIKDLDALRKRTRFGLRSHARLIELIRQGDGAATESHWRQHMIEAGKFWLSQLGPNSIVDLLD